jgi:glycerate kinase
MKIIVALDSFKHSMTAAQACAAVSDELHLRMPSATVLQRPMADGGEGTARTMIDALGGEWIEQTVTGPLPEMQVTAGFAWFEETRTALVEMASASGLERLTPAQRNPLQTTTYGTGQLIKAALGYQPEKILLAVGGSATVDGGVGAAAALGWQFLDAQGNPLSPGGGSLTELAAIRPPAALHLPPVQVFCDVTNPLCGPLGAARVYGPQKGATPERVEQLEAGLSRLGRMVSEQLGIDLLNLPGAGAAGGLAAGAVAFMGATLTSGIEAIIKLYKLHEELIDAAWIITGEGAFDEQSLYGKVVSGIVKAAAGTGAKVAVLAGQVKIPPEVYRPAGVSAALACKPDGMSVEEAIRRGRILLQECTNTFISQCIQT